MGAYSNEYGILSLNFFILKYLLVILYFVQTSLQQFKLGAIFVVLKTFLHVLYLQYSFHPEWGDKKKLRFD